MAPSNDLLFSYMMPCTLIKLDILQRNVIFHLLLSSLLKQRVVAKERLASGETAGGFGIVIVMPEPLP